MTQATARPYVYWGLCDQCETCACKGRTLIGTASPAGTAPLRYRLMSCPRNTARCLGLEQDARVHVLALHIYSGGLTCMCMFKCNVCELMRAYACRMSYSYQTTHTVGEFTDSHKLTRTRAHRPLGGRISLDRDDRVHGSPNALGINVNGPETTTFRNLLPGFRHCQNGSRD